MKQTLQKMQNSLFLLYKLVLYALLLLAFLLLFSINNPAILVPSRTMATTIVTFVVVGLLMTATYGRFDVGRRKSKPIIYSVSFAVLITDIISYLQLMIMNTITPDIFAFRLSNLGYLILTLLCQVFAIVLFTYLGNMFYFMINPPSRSCIITTETSDVRILLNNIRRFKKQYQVTQIVDYRHANIEKIIRKTETVFFYDVPLDKRGELITCCFENRKNAYICPEVCDVIGYAADRYTIEDSTMLYISNQEITYEQRIIKRAFDIFVSLFGLIILSPAFLVIAIMIKADDGGKVIYKQRRATKNCKSFHIYKFRTMKEGVENHSVAENDDRITKTGAKLRKTRLDELPQLLNILRGDMSIVGPRPEMMENVYAYTKDLPEFKYRLHVKAGLLGYAQVTGKYNTSPKDKLIMDLMYIENYSIWNDLKLIMQTILVILFKKDSTEAFSAEEEIEEIKIER